MPEPSARRNPIPDEWIDAGFKDLKDKMAFRLETKGRGTLVSPQEIWGLKDEEVREFKNAVEANDKNKAAQELLDIAVAALFGYVCLKHNSHNMDFL